jgi:putative effector of murein hydrolase LrgA (UPF0299 family)
MSNRQMFFICGIICFAIVAIRYSLAASIVGLILFLLALASAETKP